MEAPEEEERLPALGGGDEGRSGGSAEGLPRQLMGRTPWDVCHVRETEGEVLVVGTVPGRASVRDDLRKLSMHSIVRHRDELHPTYPPTIHFKWMVDLVTMPMGIGQMRYLVLAREDLMN